MANCVDRFLGMLVFWKSAPPEPTTDDPWPLDVKCPQCGAKTGMFCDAYTEANHSGRYEASPGAHTAKREKLAREDYGERMKHETQSDPETTAPVNPVPLPCPFCGESEPTKLIVDLDIAGVICKGCESTGPFLLDQDFESDEAAIDAATVAWNRRHGISNETGDRK